MNYNVVMIIDSFVMAAVVRELKEKLNNARVERITMPEPDTVVFWLHCYNPSDKKSEDYKLLLSANSSIPRVYLTTNAGANPITAPSFCMHLRKRLTNAQLINITQPDYERVLVLEFDTKDELMDSVRLRLIFELMGRHSNIILLNSDDIISDCLKRTPLGENTTRVLFSGFKYTLPEQKNRIRPDSEEGLKSVVLDTTDISELSTNLNKSLAGVGKDTLKSVLALTASHEPSVLAKTFKDCFIGVVELYKGVNERLDSFFSEKGKSEHMGLRQKELATVVRSAIAKLDKKIRLLNERIQESADAESFRIKGEELLCNIHTLGSSATKEAQDNFKKYKKLKKAAQFCTQQITEAKELLEYLATIEESLRHSSTQSELQQIENELKESGFLKAKKSNSKFSLPKSSPNKTTFKGFSITIGKNNVQNDELTRQAKPLDIWLHAKNVPASHVIISANDKTIPTDVIEHAAKIAAFYSKAHLSDRVEVDYTFKKFVKKPSGAKPGAVIYTNQKTLTVKPQEI